MKFLAPHEVAEFVRQSPFPEFIGSMAASPTLDSATVCFAYQCQVATELHIARKIALWLGQWESCLLAISDYGIWPSHENAHLLELLRKAYGEENPVSKKPGHLFLRGERDEFVTFLEVALRFGWGGHILGKAGEAMLMPAFWFTHDGHFCVKAAPALTERIMLEIESGDLSVNRIS